MRIQRISAGWQVLAPAKLNLFLEVLGRRDDGFHELETLMVPISLFDTLTIHDDPARPLRLTCRWAPGLLAGPLKKGTGSERPNGDDVRLTSPRGACPLFQHAAQWEDLPQDDDNLALRAVKLLRREAGIDRGARLELIKRIPSAAGLGGGSSDAAAALMAGNRGWGLDWPLERLHGLAAQLGSDVPFFLGSGPAICRGRGEWIEPLPGMTSLNFVVVCPPEGLSTAVVYKQCRPADAPRRVESLVEPLALGDARRLVRGFFNRLEETARRLSTWVARCVDELIRCGCLAAQMSGSGTSCFGLCATARQARRLAATLRARGWSRAFAVRAL